MFPTLESSLLKFSCSSVRICSPDFFLYEWLFVGLYILESSRVELSLSVSCYEINFSLFH